MKITEAIFACIVLIGASKLAAAKEWRGIVPLYSTRADVEKQLGRSKNSNNQNLSDYETENEEITVMYSSGPPCGSDGFRMWNVPRETVIGIIVHSKKALKFSDLRLDERRFKKTDNQGHGPPYFYYTNEEEGLQYEVTQGRVMATIYLPAAKDNHLRCQASQPKPLHANAFHGIVPLHSTRADVERLLGKPNGKYGRYELENEWVEIFYSKGRCVNGWDVPDGTVIAIEVSPTRPLRLSDLKIDLSKYGRFRDPHTSHVYYAHRSEGVRYVVSEPEGETNGKVLTTYYESTIDDKRLLYCRKPRDSSTDRLGFAQAWQQIRPLRTSRKQVEKLLGPPEVIGGVNTYDFPNETVSIFYVKRSCRIDSQGWNVPANTVRSVRIAPKKKTRLPETQWDLSKFRKEQGSFDNPSYLLFRKRRRWYHFVCNRRRLRGIYLRSKAKR